MKSLKTRGRIVAKPHAHAMKTVAHIAPPPPHFR